MPTLIRLPQDAKPGENVDFAGIFDAIPEPLAYIGPERTLTACNRRFRELFPVLLEERLLQCLPQAAGATSASGAAAAGARAAATGPAPQFIAAGQRLAPRAKSLADGGVLISFENAVPPPEIEAVYRNTISDLRTRLDAAQEALDEALGKANARKNALIATSHELRTPLNAILGFAEMMERQTFGPLGHERYREYAAIVRESGTYLLGLINDLLDLAKLDAGKSDLRLGQVEVLKVIVDCVKAMEPLAARSHVGMSVHVYDGVSTIVGDEMRLHQMVLNLLSNAVKFTRKDGEICIDVFRRGRRVGISVSDSGLGISEADMARVMRPFEQADAGAVRAAGTGLGLPLTRELAELHGGELKLESTVGEGSTVTILLPADGPQRPVMLEGPAAAARAVPA